MPGKGFLMSAYKHNSLLASYSRLLAEDKAEELFNQLIASPSGLDGKDKAFILIDDIFKYFGRVYSPAKAMTPERYIHTMFMILFSCNLIIRRDNVNFIVLLFCYRTRHLVNSRYRVLPGINRPYLSGAINRGLFSAALEALQTVLVMTPCPVGMWRNQPCCSLSEAINVSYHKALQNLPNTRSYIYQDTLRAISTFDRLSKNKQKAFEIIGKIVYPVTTSVYESEKRTTISKGKEKEGKVEELEW